jgi:hypothetical protein
VFDEPVASPVAGNFFLVTFDNARFRGTAASVESGRPEAVLVRFGAFREDVGQTQFDRLALATVDFNAVKDTDGNENPEGSDPIRAGEVIRTAGRTTAPDLESVQVIGAAATAGQTTVRFTFDQDAFVVNASDQRGFHVVLKDGITDITCTGIPTNTDIRATGRRTFDATCGVQPSATPTTTTTTSSTTTTTSTTSTTSSTSTTTTAPTTTTTTAPVPTSEDIVRGYVDEGTVSSVNEANPTTSGGSRNPLQAADVSASGNSETPDLVSASIDQDAVVNGEQRDTITYTFDEAVTVGTVTRFRVYNFDASEQTPCTFPASEATPVQRSGSNTNQVVVICNDGQLANAVGASVDDGAVNEGTTTSPRPNQEDEVAVENPAGSRSTGPELVAVAYTASTDGFRLTYTFDEDVDVADSTKLRLYLADGAQLTCGSGVATAGTTEATDNTVTCTSYNQEGSAGAATAELVQRAVLGAVDNGAVRGQGTTGTADENPEGAVAMSGGSGGQAA